MTNAALQRYRVARGSLTQTREELAIAEKTAATALESRDTIQAVAQEVEQRAHNRIAGIVTKCLASVFDDPYQFQIKFEKKRGKTEASLVFVREGEEIDPLTASGGGVIDVASFALRIACVVLSVPRKRQIVVLDEPFKFVSVDLRAKVKVMIELLSKELDIQFIIVTHMPELTCGKVIEL